MNETIEENDDRPEYFRANEQSCITPILDVLEPPSGFGSGCPRCSSGLYNDVRVQEGYEGQLPSGTTSTNRVAVRAIGLYYFIALGDRGMGSCARIKCQSCAQARWRCTWCSR